MNKSQLEIEKKYIIEKPSFDMLALMPEYSSSDIVQIYLSSDIGVTHRIRKRSFHDKTVYTETKKIRIDKMSAAEAERDISSEEFSELSKNILRGSKKLNKMRHTFFYEAHTFEIDVYPEWEKTAVLEVELESREENIEFPSFIKIIRDVTGNKAYSNASMSMHFPDEDYL